MGGAGRVASPRGTSSPCLLAAHFGAARITLAGFDFEHPRPKPGRDPEVKRRKLAWAKRLIAMAGVPVEVAPVPRT